VSSSNKIISPTTQQQNHFAMDAGEYASSGRKSIGCQHQKSVALGLVALAFASLALSEFPWLLRKIRERGVNRLEKRLVKVAMSNIARHIRKFAQLTGLQVRNR
jgi:hypothetical protein